MIGKGFGLKWSSGASVSLCLQRHANQVVEQHANQIGCSMQIRREDVISSPLLDIWFVR